MVLYAFDIKFYGKGLTFPVMNLEDAMLIFFLLCLEYFSITESHFSMSNEFLISNSDVVLLINWIFVCACWKFCKTFPSSHKWFVCYATYHIFNHFCFLSHHKKTNIPKVLVEFNICQIHRYRYCKKASREICHCPKSTWNYMPI